MSNLWFFGDSFCSHSSNWTELTRLRYGYKKSIVLGSSGTGILYSIKELINKYIHIKKEDGVVFCISQPDRYTFKNKPFGVDILSGNHKFYKDKFKISENEINAFKIFFNTFYNEEESFLRSMSMVNTLIDKILPSLSTNKISTFFSFNDFHFKNYNYIDYDFLSLPSLHSLKNQYIYEYLNLDDDAEIRLGGNHNHWPGSNYWNDLFFPTYKKELDKLRKD